MKNLNVNFKKLLLIGALGGSLALTTGCNRNILIGTQSFDKAIIVKDNNAVIINIASWKDFDGEQFELTTKDGMVILTSSFDTKLINSENSDKKVEELCELLVGPDGTISYYDHNSKVKTKNR